MRGMPFSMVEGEVLETREDGSTVRKVLRASVLNYEFMVPVVSSGSPVGRLYLALDAHTLAAQRQEALRRILLLSLVVLVLGAAGVYAVSSRFTAPIERLSEGITRLPGARQAEEIYISSRDELGDLTLKFNTMARTITEQKRELRENADELERAYVSTLRLLATVIDARDPYTRGHSARVARLSVLLGRKMGLVEEELRDLEVASMFHDVGKIKTPDSILNKKEPLNGEEYEEMMRHTRHGADILDVVDSLKKYVPAVLFHHERFDGSGYPEGLRQAEIPLMASLISIPDAFDAMTSARPYRPAMSREEAVREMLRFKGVQFDPRMLEHFIKALEGYEPDRPGFTFLVERELT
jgi:HD-GYP domain-containing protein (c-di-GMP phosphodiesterase class II)